MDLPELLGDAAAPRLRLGAGAGFADLRRLARLADGRLAGRGAVARGRRLGLGAGLRRETGGALDLDRRLGWDGLGHRLLFDVA